MIIADVQNTIYIVSKKAWKKVQGFSWIRTQALCVAGAILY